MYSKKMGFLLLSSLCKGVADISSCRLCPMPSWEWFIWYNSLYFRIIRFLVDNNDGTPEWTPYLFDWTHLWKPTTFPHEFSVVLEKAKVGFAISTCQKPRSDRPLHVGTSAKVAHLKCKSHADEGQKSCSGNASVGLLTVKSPTLVIHNL